MRNCGFAIHPSPDSRPEIGADSHTTACSEVTLNNLQVSGFSHQRSIEDCALRGPRDAMAIMIHVPISPMNVLCIARLLESMSALLRVLERTVGRIMQ